MLQFWLALPCWYRSKVQVTLECMHLQDWSNNLMNLTSVYAMLWAQIFSIWLSTFTTRVGHPCVCIDNVHSEVDKTFLTNELTHTIYI